MHCVWDKTSKSLTVRQPALSNSDPHSTAVALAPLIQLAIPGHLRSMAGLVDTSVRRDVFYSAIVLPSCVLTAYLCFRWTYLFVAGTTSTTIKWLTSLRLNFTAQVG